MVLSLFGDLIGSLIGSEENAPTDQETISHCFRPGILLDTGIYWVQDNSNIIMYSRQFFRKVLITGVAVGAAGSGPHSTKCDQVCRASELPIYMSEKDCSQETERDVCPAKPSFLECTFGSIRRNVWSAMDKCKIYTEEANKMANKAENSVENIHKYLSEDCDDNTRKGVVGAGALTGFVLGLRGGIIRKLFFSGMGAYAMAAICYPEQTKQYTLQSIREARRYAAIGYNFTAGVKKDEISVPQLPQLPKLPSSFGEVWEIAGELSKSASSLIAVKENEKTDKEKSEKPK